MVRQGCSSGARRECGRGFPQGAVLMLSLADRAAAPAHVLVRLLDRESVLLNLETDQFCGLDEIGTRMWQLVTDAPSLDVAYGQLLAGVGFQPRFVRSNFL